MIIMNRSSFYQSSFKTILLFDYEVSNTYIHLQLEELFTEWEEHARREMLNDKKSSGAIVK